MPPITRKDLHYNFLKKIIVRLDFQGVFEPEMEAILMKVKPYAREKGFNRYNERISNQIDVSVSQINDQPPQAATNQIRSQKVYSFIDETRGYVLDISSTFVCLNISSTRYTPFEEYGEYISTIAKMYQETIDFFTVKRFGLRKINECFVDDLNKVNRYFNPTYLSVYSELPGVNTIQSSRANVLCIDKYRVNLRTNIAQGLADGKTVYQLALDFDAYLDETGEIEALLLDEKKLQSMNDLLFDIYIHALSDSFQKELTTNGDLTVDGLMGIERND